MKDFTDYQVRVLEKENIDCIDVVRLMGDYHDQELPRTLRGRLHAHIENCSICAEMYAGYSFVVNLASELKESEVQLSNEARNRLRERLNKNLGINLPTINF
jgi:hypothetical protein